MTLGIADAIRPTLIENGTEAVVEWITRVNARAAGTTTETGVLQSPNPFCVTENFEVAKIDGTNIRFGDLMATFLKQDLDNVPAADTTRVQIIGTWYTVVNYEPFLDGSTVAAYRLQLRAG